MDPLYVPEPAILPAITKPELVHVAKIKAEKPDYDDYDPRTWPRVVVTSTAEFLRSVNRKKLPCAVAYTKTFMFTLVIDPRLHIASLRREQLHFAKGAGSINICFYHYPFNFTQDGGPRDRIGLSKDDLECWMSYVHRKKWIVELEHAAEPASAEPTASTTTPPKTAYDRVMAFLAQQKATLPTYAALQHQLTSLKARYQQAQDRSNDLSQKSAQQMANDAALLSSLHSKLAAANDSAENMTNTAAKYKTRALAAEKKVEELQRDVDMARNEVREIKEAARKETEIVDAEVKALGEARGGNRGAGDGDGDDGGGGEGGRVKRVRG